MFRHDLGEHPPDLARACWVDGLQFKGAAAVGRPRGQPIASFLVSGADSQGSDGVVIAGKVETFRSGSCLDLKNLRLVNTAQ